MKQVILGDLQVTVDDETAEKLKDPVYAEKYLLLVKQMLTTNSPNEENHDTASSKSTLWKSSKCPTEEDHKATLALLALRKEMDNAFKDKKNNKNQLWQKIVNNLNEQGFYVGTGIEGREKVRLKFMNLQSSYTKYCDLRRQTGQGKINSPKYFDEIDSILGDKHKINPVIVIDSATGNSSQVTSKPESYDVEELSAPSTSTSIQELADDHRFINVKKRLRPPLLRHQVLTDLVNIQRKNQEIRKEEFKSMMELFQQQNNQRHEQLVALINQMNKHRNKSKKRKTASETDSDD